MKFLALTDCPTANEGEVFETTEEVGAVLASVGAARRLSDEEAEAATRRPSRRRYQRRDVEAEA